MPFSGRTRLKRAKWRTDTPEERSRAELETHFKICSGNEDGKVVKFISKLNNPPHRHPNGYVEKPDFITLSKSAFDKLTNTPGWHYDRSVGEWKSGTTFSEEEIGQEREYIASAIQARPDNPSMLGILMRRGGFCVHSLHVPVDAIDFRDPQRTI
ncbi:hypothetical protein D9758_003431 [Tetrapyrgos nigripes]|uniref:Uncharacterized protein n=1 Tax=Tetrapyrgos nigripes TaxID=182062 RepID=A0A8H5GVB0_9AGAR|nr:hypothetical protein D9758_003431 [Tetrapyrgos nigripes]